MRWRTPLGAALLVLLAAPATGFGWFPSLFSRSSRAAPATAYYCPVPVFAVPVAAPVVAVAPVPYAAPPVAVAPVPYPAPPVAPPRLYAEPRPAPPSGSTPEPPRAGVSGQESRKVGDRFYDSYFAANASRSAAGRCAVTFWNLSGQSLTLSVDGQAHAVPAGQSVRLDLKRDFAWSVAGRDPERQQVPAQESGVEIVIRR